LTLAKDVELMSRLVDYGRNYAHVYRDVINHIVNTTETLGIIYRPSATVCPCLPSCVCQVKQHSFTAGSLARRDNANCLVGPSSRAIYSAGGRTPAEQLWREEEGRVFLKVQRFVFDCLVYRRTFHKRRHSKEQAGSCKKCSRREGQRRRLYR
jgi:hypothetical protein